jgi:hypothetical protein
LVANVFGVDSLRRYRTQLAQCIEGLEEFRVRHAHGDPAAALVVAVVLDIAVGNDAVEVIGNLVHRVDALVEVVDANADVAGPDQVLLVDVRVSGIGDGVEPCADAAQRVAAQRTRRGGCRLSLLFLFIGLLLGRSLLPILHVVV